jgi:hypothetical protein
MDDFSEKPSGADEPAVDGPAVDEPAVDGVDRPEAAQLRRFGPHPSKRRFHASRYQFDLKAMIWLFTFFSVVFLPMSLVAPQDRFGVAVMLAVCACLAVYAFALISWIPDSALVVFLVSAPFILVALGLVASYWILG